MILTDERSFRQLLEDAEVALIVLGRDLQVQYWNTLARRLFTSESTGDDRPDQPTDFLILMPEGRRAHARKLLNRLLRHGEAHEFEIGHRRVSGETRNLAVLLSPIRGEDGSVDGAAAWIRDITERVQWQQKLAHARKMASLGSLAGGVAHHFNNLLGGLMTRVDYALASDDTAVWRRALQSAAGTLNRAARLTSDLLAFAEGDRRTADLSDLTETVLYFADELEKAMPAERVRLRTQVEPIPVVEVQGTTMLTVLRHLVDNACEAMPHGGELTIALRRLGNEAVIEITDNGAGISEADLQRVFEPFFTTKPPATDAGPGHLGLGLAVVHGMVQDIGGRISISSSPGQGTTLQIAMPLGRDTGRTPPLE